MKPKLSLTLIFTILLSLINSVSVLNAQILKWANHYTNNSDNDEGYDVHLGGDNRIYACGNKAGPDAFITCYSAAGITQSGWPKSYNGSSNSNDVFYAVTTDGTGTSTVIYAVGFASMTSNGQDMLLVKYNYSGTQQWVVTWNNSGASQDIAMSVITDGSANVYVCGRTSLNGGDLFCRKYNSSGTFQWGITYNSTGTQDDSPQFMSINQSSIYITSVRTISGTDHNAVLQKINTSTGSIDWTAVWDGGISNDIDETYSLDFDGGQNIYCVGTTQTTSNGYDALLLKYNSSGTLQCANTWNNSSYNLDDKLASVDVYNPVDGPEVYVTGYTQINVAQNDANILTMRFNGSTCTTPVWTATYDGTGGSCPTSNDDIGLMIKVSTWTGDIFVSGQTWETGGGLNATTIRYTASNGTQEWAMTYDRNSTDNLPAPKYPLELQYDACANADFAYVIGYTRESSSGTRDITTLQYGFSSLCDGPDQRLASTGEENLHPVVFPNPVNDFGTYRYTVSDAELIGSVFSIYDLSGREVRRIDYSMSNEFLFYTDGMENGLYFYQFVNGDAILDKGKFIVNHQ